MKNRSDHQLVEAIRQNDEEAFQILYQRYFRLVRYLAYQLTHNDDDTQEVVQETFLQVYVSIHQLKDAKLLKAWISRITYSKVQLLFRKQNHEKKHTTHQEQEIIKEYRLDHIPSADMRYKNDIVVLQKCLSKLKMEFQEVLIFYYFSQMKTHEIAEMMNVPEGTIKSRLLYGKKYLRQEIEKYEKENDIKLTFRMYGTEILLFLLGRSLVEPKMHILAYCKWLIRSHKKAILTNCIAWGCGITIVTSGAMHLLNNDAFIQEGKANTQQVVQDRFQAIHYQGNWIQTPKEAYHALIHYADCQVEMKEKTETEDIEIKQVYDALMTYGGGYADLLKTRQWNILFEEKIKKFNNF